MLSSMTYAQEDFPFVGEVTSDNVNLRAGQNINFERLTQLNTGEEIVVVAKNYDWYKTRLPDSAICYVNVKFVQPSFDGYAKVIGNRVNVRAGTEEKSSIIGQLSQGTTIKLLGQVGEWFQIEPIDGLYGWISEKFISFKSKDVPPIKVIIEPIRNVYKKEETAPESEEGKKPQLFSVVGRIEDLGRILLSKSIRYKIITPDNNKIYYLEDENNLAGPFVLQTVKVEGALKEKQEGFLPEEVLIVERITPAP